MASPSKSIPAPTVPQKKFKDEWFWCYLFIAPLLIGILTFSVFPLFYALGISFTEWDGLTKAQFNGIQNFVRLFQDPAVMIEIKNTFIYALGVVPPTIIIAIVLANVLNMPLKGKTVFRTIYYLPNVTMAAAVAIIWRWLFSSYGPLAQFSQLVGLPVLAWTSDPKLIMPAICIVSVWGGVGYSAVMLLAGLQGIPKSYYEAAEIDGASGFYIFMKITIPLLTPTIFFIMITTVMNAFKAFDLIYMFGPKQMAGATGPLVDAIRTMVYGVYIRGFTLFEMGYAAAESFVLFIMILIITGIQFAVQKRWVFYD